MKQIDWKRMVQIFLDTEPRSFLKLSFKNLALHLPSSIIFFQFLFMEAYSEPCQIFKMEHETIHLSCLTGF